MTKKNLLLIIIFLVLIALVDQLAAAYEEDEERRKLFSQGKFWILNIFQFSDSFYIFSIENTL